MTFSCSTRRFSALLSKGNVGMTECESIRKGRLRSGSTSLRELLGGGEEVRQGSLRRPQFLVGEEAREKAPAVLFPLGLLAGVAQALMTLLGRGFQFCT